MNKIYKVIWNRVRHCYVVVSEIAKNHGKEHSTNLRVSKGLCALTLAIGLSLSSYAFAADTSVPFGDKDDKGNVLASADYDKQGNLTIGNKGTVAQGEKKAGKNNTTIGTDSDTLRNVTEGDTTKSGQPMDKDNKQLVKGEGQANDLTVSTEAEGSTAVGYQNRAEGERSTAIGNNAKIIDKPVVYYADKDGNKTTNKDSAAWYKDKDGKPTQVPQVFRDADGKTTTIPQYVHTYTEKDPTTGEEVTKTEITSDASKADQKDGKPVYNYQKSDNTDHLYSVTLYQASNDSIAAGSSVSAQGSKAVAVGYNSSADNSAVAIGDTAVAKENTVAIGKDTKATADGSIALGAGSQADRSGGVTGWDPKTGTTSVKTGTEWTSGAGALSVGNGTSSRQITNVAAGSEDSDAVNLAQLKEAMTHYYSVKTTETTDKAGNNNYLNDGATGNNALAAGVSAVAKGNNATAVGTQTYASGEDASAYGYRAAAMGKDSVSIGSGTSAQNEGSIAVGGHAQGYYAVQVGTGSTAQSAYSVAVGGHAQGDHSVEVGYGSTAQGSYSASVGGHAIGNYSIAIGSSKDNWGYINAASAAGDNSIAIGGHTNSANEIAIGAGSATSGGQAITVGGSSTGNQAVSIGGVATNGQAIAVGYGSSSTGSQSTAVGGHAGDTNSTAVGQGANANYAYATAVGNSSVASGDHSTALGYGTSSQGSYSTAIGGASAKGSNVTAIGKNSTVGGYWNDSISDSTVIGGAHISGSLTSGTAIGSNASVTDSYGVALGQNASVAYRSTGVGTETKASNTGTAVGYGAQSSGYQSAAVGAGSMATGQNAVSLGGGGAWGDYSIALGSGAGTTAHAIALGQNSGAWGTNAIAIGEGSNAWRANSIVLGKNSKSGADKNIEGYDPRTGVASVDDTSTWQSTDEAVSIGRAEERDGDGNITATAITRQLNNLAAGTLDTDAVNVAQLKAATQKVNVHDYSVWSPDTETDTNYTNEGAVAKNSMAAGVSASTTKDAENAVAIGYKAKAEGVGATVIGQYGTATGRYALAFGGQQTDTTAEQANNVASGDNAVSFGERTAASGNNSTAFGWQTKATEKRATAFGERTTASGANSTAFGQLAVASGQNSTAFGNEAVANNYGSTAFGNRTEALGEYSTAFGNSTVAAGMNTVAFGTDNVAGAVLDGNGAYTNIIYQTNPKNGRVIKDANGNPIEISREKMDARGNMAYTDSNGNTKAVTYTVPGGETHSYVLLQGEDGNTYIRDYRGNIRSATIADDGTVTVGDTPLTNVNLKKANAGANGYHILSNANATVWGENSIASGEASTAFGIGSNAAAKNSLAALGGTVDEIAVNAVAIGNDAKATLADSVALGSGALANRPSGSKGYDVLTGTASTNTSAAWVSSANAIAIGNDTEGSMMTRQITGVAAGSQDTDAVNVAQLKAAGFKVTTQKNDAISSSILNGDTLDFEGKDNAIVSTSKDSKTITVAVSKTPTFDSATFGTTNNEKVTIANGQVSAYNNQQQKRAVVGVDNQGNGTLFLVNKDLSQAHLYTQSSKETGNDGITRMYYTSSTDNGGEVKGVHTIAVLDDGINYVGDNYTDDKKTDKVVVKHKLNSTMDVTGGADTSNLSDNNIGVVATPAIEDGKGNITQRGKLEIKLNKDINLKQDGSLTVGGDKQDGSTTGQDPIIIKHFDAGKLTVTGTDKVGKTPQSKAGDYVTGLDNKDWDVDYPTYVSGRAATEDQLKKISDIIKSNTETAAGQHTEITVNDKKTPTIVTSDKVGTTDYGDYVGGNDNLLIAAKKDSTSNKMTYNIKLNDQLAIGQKGEPGVAGKDGKDGKVTVETKGGTTVVIGHDGKDGDNGKDGLFVTGKDGKDGKSGVSIIGPNGAAGADGVDGKVGIAGKDGKDAVSISGKDGIGHIGLTGQKGADGKDGVFSDLSTILGTATLDPAKNEQSKSKDTVSADDKSSRIQYQTTVTDKDGKTKTVITHEVATMDDGMKYAGDFGDGASVKLNKTVTIKGKVKDGAKEDDFVDGNIAVVANKSKNGEDAELLIKLNKDLTGLNSATYTTSTKNGDVTTTSKTVVDGTGLKIENGPNITNAGIDGGSKKITNVADGDISATSKEAVNGSQLNAVKTLAEQHTTVEAGPSGNVTVTPGTNADGSKKYTVDLAKDVTFGNAGNGDKTVAISGTNGTVTAGTGDNKVTVDGSKGQIVAGGDNGVKIGKIAESDSSLTIYDKNGNATDKKADGGKYVTGLENKTWNADGTGSYVSGRAATEDQLHQLESSFNTKVEAVEQHHTEVTVNGGDKPEKADGSYTKGNLQLAQTTKDGKNIYDLKLSDNLSLGTVGKDGAKGTDGSIGLKGADGKSSIGLNGKDGISVIGADGKNGVSITGSNGLNGKDGIDGKIAIGTPGKDGQPGKDAISISGQNGEGHIGLTGPAGKDGKDASADIHVKNGQVGVDGTDGHGGKDGMDRVVYEDHNGTPHEVATMDDGMKYGDDFGNTAKVKLNHQLDIVGDINAGKKDGDKKATKDDLSDGNIGIIATDTTYNEDGTVKENGKMTVKLAKDLKGLNSIESNSVTTGNTTINNGGLTIKTGDANRTITVQDGNVDMGGNQIHNVAPGQAPEDAVNVSQLNATNYAVNKLGTRVNRVGAGAAALAALHPLDFDPDDKWDFAAGYGNYKDASAVAVGAYYRPNEDTMFSVGGSFGGGENMVNAGVSFKVGQGNHVSTSRVAMAKEIKDLRQDVANLNAIVNRQSALIDKLTGTNAGTIQDADNDLFPDVPANHWAYEYVTKLKHAGILTGYPDGNFDGDRMMTRYEFAAIVYRAIMAGAASNPALSQDGTLDKLAKEFSPEMKHIRIDTIAKDKNGKPTIERVRVIPEAQQ